MDIRIAAMIPPALWNQPLWARLLAELLEVGSLVPGRPDDSLAALAVGLLAERLGAPIGLLARRADGAIVVAAAGAASAWPLELASEALDQAGVVRSQCWLAAPVSCPQFPAAVLCVEGPSEVRARGWEEAWPVVARVLAEALCRGNQAAENRRRATQLAEVLELARVWSARREMRALLHDIAAEAARLLTADRATIFFWDRATRTLVGRPALGVAGEELRIPDDTGVVGRVVRTGKPERVELGHAADQVDPQVDREQGYQTRTLLCVPLLGADGRPQGAFQVLNKHQGNFHSDDEVLLTELARHAAVALENTGEREQLLRQRTQLVDQAAERVQLVGSSPAIEALRSTIGRVAQTDLAVLVLGENGTGKEVVSRAIHYQSPRREHPLVAVNCAAISETLLESELFGHEKGAFTDAHEARAGKFEAAAGGTLFLDEIGDLSAAGQAKLLRALEEKMVVRVGGSRPIHCDVRVIAATNQPLAELVRQRKFRQDLFYRLSVVTLDLPPLRERPEDVAELARFFLEEFSRRARRSTLTLTAAARSRLAAHSWPGNVRELRNLIERLAYLLPGDVIDAGDLVFATASSVSPYGDGASDAEGLLVELPLAEATDQFQIQHIRRAIRQAGGSMTTAAQRLGLHRSNLYRKMRQLGMPTDSL